MTTMPENKDFILVQNFIKGDESAFNEIVKLYRQRIYWHARRMLGNHMDADEVTQEVLIVIYKKLDTFKFNSSLYTWIYRIVSTRSINFINRKKIKDFISIDDDETRELRENSDIVEGIENKQKIEKLNIVLQKIPPKQREVFIMRNFNELSYEEISEITGKSVGALKANYFHALKKVMELMENEN